MAVQIWVGAKQHMSPMQLNAEELHSWLSLVLPTCPALFCASFPQQVCQVCPCHQAPRCLLTSLHACLSACLHARLYIDFLPFGLHVICMSLCWIQAILLKMLLLRGRDLFLSICTLLGGRGALPWLFILCDYDSHAWADDCNWYELHHICCSHALPSPCLEAVLPAFASLAAAFADGC